MVGGPHDGFVLIVPCALKVGFDVCTSGHTFSPVIRCPTLTMPSYFDSQILRIFIGGDRVVEHKNVIGGLRDLVEW